MAEKDAQFEDWFTGRFDGKLDKKNRIQIPKWFREKLNGEKSIVLSLGRKSEMDYLEVWRKSDWDRLMEKIRASFEPEEYRVIMIGYMNHSLECNLDGQDRFVIPPSFQEMGSFDDTQKLFWFGAGKWMEIWSQKVFLERAKTARRQADALLSKVKDLYY